MAIIERELLLEGPIFDFHDYGRKCIPTIHVQVYSESRGSHIFIPPSHGFETITSHFTGDSSSPEVRIQQQHNDTVMIDHKSLRCVFRFFQRQKE